MQKRPRLSNTIMKLQNSPRPLRGGLLILVMLLVLLFPVWPARALASPQAAATDLEGELRGAPYKIRVPANWNGILLIHLHGYRDKADHAGEVDDRSVEAAPGGLPAEQFLLSQGFAIAGTAYKDNGFAVKEGIKDTKRLTNFFIERFGQPRQTILIGVSLGTVIALKSMEKYRSLYDATICACGLGAGTSLNIDLQADLALAYDVAFGWPASWGSPADVRDDLDFDSEVVPVLASQLQDPANLGRFEFIRLVTDTPLEGFYPAAGNPLPMLFLKMFFATEARAELERRAGGPVVQNLDHEYKLAGDQKTYLASLNANAEGLLATMSARRNISAPPFARDYLAQFADYNGKIKGPVLALHNRLDGIAHPGNVSVYRETLESRDRGDLFVSTFVNSAGHCNFTPDHLAAVVAAMLSWLNTGVKPGPEFFPEAAGFLSNFTPPSFPQPAKR